MDEIIQFLFKMYFHFQGQLQQNQQRQCTGARTSLKKITLSRLGPFLIEINKMVT